MVQYMEIMNVLQNKSKDEADEEYDVAGEDVLDALCVTKRFESHIPMTSRIPRGLVKYGRCLKLPECDLSHIGELTLQVLAPSESLFFSTHATERRFL